MLVMSGIEIPAKLRIVRHASLVFIAAVDGDEVASNKTGGTLGIATTDSRIILFCDFNASKCETMSLMYSSIFSDSIPCSVGPLTEGAILLTIGNGKRGSSASADFREDIKTSTERLDHPRNVAFYTNYEVTDGGGSIIRLIVEN